MAETVVERIEYIVKTPGVCAGQARIAGRRIPAHNIVQAHVREGVTITELAEAHDLTLAQIYAALAYYYDHRAEIEQEIEEEEQAQARLVERFGDAVEQDKLRVEWRKKHPQPPNNPDREMTASEVAEAYSVTPQAVRIAAARGRLPARKSGSIWLIHRRDAEARWGSQGSNRR